MLTLDQVTRLLDAGATLALLSTLHGDDRHLRALLRQLGRRASRGANFTHEKWEALSMSTDAISDNHGLLCLYSAMYQAYADVHDPVTTAVVATIDLYIAYAPSPVYTADGAYAVLRQHIAGRSILRECSGCGTSYWGLWSGAGCPLCEGSHVATCENCGRRYPRPRSAGRPRKYCSDTCREQHKRTRKSSVA